MFKLVDIEDKDYFAKGDIWDGFLTPLERNKEWVVSASKLKQVYKTNLYDLVLPQIKVAKKEDNRALLFGSAFHCYCLETSEFYNRYEVTDGASIADNKQIITLSEFDIIQKLYKNLEVKYPELLDCKNTEKAIFGEIDGVKVKCKIDKFKITQKGDSYHVEIRDLKSVFYSPYGLGRGKNGERTKLIYALKDLNYDLQAYFYLKIATAWVKEWKQTDNVTGSFHLDVCSKEDLSVQSYKLSEEFIYSGNLKFNNIWDEVTDFILNKKLKKEEVL